MKSRQGRLNLACALLLVALAALAPAAPPQLATMVAIVATPDFYHHAAFQGGALREALVEPWLEGQESLSFLGALEAHRRWDDWWRQTAVLPHAGEINVPALHIGAWYDIFQQGTLDAFTAMQHRGGPGAAGRQYLSWDRGRMEPSGCARRASSPTRRTPRSTSSA